MYLFAEVEEKVSDDGSLSKSADRDDGAFPFCAAIDSRSRTHLTVSQERRLEGSSSSWNRGLCVWGGGMVEVR